MHRPLLASAVALAAACLAALPAAAATTRPGLETCRLDGLETAAFCGRLERPLDPSHPEGTKISLRFAVVPAVARNRKSDPILFFAGGPGQAAVALGGTIAQMMARFSNRRDIVLIDQRGTGESAPLLCGDEDESAGALAENDIEFQVRKLQACRERLQKLPHGDLRRYTTTIAMQDADAVRAALGVEKLDVVGGSYGTRAVLEYLRQFPQHVRRAVIDGVAPPDMGLPASFSPDNQAALDAVLAACQAETACSRAHPALAEHWQALLASLPRELTVAHPMTGETEKLTMTRDLLMALVRGPLYAPVLASALPVAVEEAAAGRFGAIAALASSMSFAKGGSLSQGMHFSVVCAEDMPALARKSDPPGRDFGEGFRRLYERVCADWPRGEVPPAFYTIPPAPVPVLLLSGSADPATPPRHAERVAQALGAKSRHVVVPNAGHGTMSLGCVRDLVFRFVDAERDEDALAVDAACVEKLPRPPAFVPVRPADRNEPAKAAKEGGK